MELLSSSYDKFLLLESTSLDISITTQVRKNQFLFKSMGAICQIWSSSCPQRAQHTVIPSQCSIRDLSKRENHSDYKVKGIQLLHSKKPWGDKFKGNVITTGPSQSREAFHKEHVSTQSKFRVHMNITDITNVTASKFKGCSSVSC